MLNSDNLVQISGRLTRDAESIMDGRQVSFSVAVDRSGYEKDSDSNAGFFDCKMWLTESDFSPAASQKDVKELFESDKLVKGIPVRVIGQLHHERWSDGEGNRRNKVVIMVENLTAYIARNRNTEAAASTTETTEVAPKKTTSFEEPF